MTNTATPGTATDIATTEAAAGEASSGEVSSSGLATPAGLRVRTRRSMPAALTALVILAACVLVAVATLQQLSGHRPVLPFAALADLGRRLHLADTPVLVAGGIAAALGLVLLLCAVLPGRSVVLPLAGDAESGIRAGVGRTGLARALRATAADVDGVVDVRVRVRPRRVAVRLRTEAGSVEHRDEIAARVQETLGRRLSSTALAREPRLRLRVSTARDIA